MDETKNFGAVESVEANFTAARSDRHKKAAPFLWGHVTATSSHKG
jgi:hypothetical protein